GASYAARDALAAASYLSGGL
ncbi:PE family protein, partial [Mycobacterium tuberculosis]